ncbi:MAG: hypothetical protein H6981_08420 [Gammaproteobacteria bacterium]|nr:hypothetical protein [Gammaproteobacteria bacterium]MCP5136811.1 hypothetical protein [Gammaproteobacteria bacterium]
MSTLWVSTLLVGFILGIVFAKTWRWAVQRFAPDNFWFQLRQLSADLLQEEQLPALLTGYKKLAKAVLRYNLANGLGVIVGLIPLLFVVDLAGDAALLRWERNADGQMVYPDGATLPPQPSRTAPVRLALCTSRMSCTGFAMLMFETRPHAGSNNILIRPDTHDQNPFWPYLSDLETGFYLSFMIGNLGFLIAPHRRLRLPPP